jgi:hypothetical protein
MTDNPKQPIEARLPTDDEREGMNWYNSLTNEGRTFWLRAAGTYVPADAWRLYKREKGRT